MLLSINSFLFPPSLLEFLFTTLQLWESDPYCSAYVLIKGADPSNTVIIIGTETNIGSLDSKGFH